LADINSAIAACPSGQVVFLSAGTYNIGQITFGSESGVTLRGAGAGQTVINTTASEAIVSSQKVFFDADGIDISNGSWLLKDSKSITLSSTPSAAFAVGNLVCITQDDSPNTWATGIGVYHRTGLSTPYGLSATRCLRFTTRITGVSGNVISLATPLPCDFSYPLNPIAHPLRSGPSVSQCGIENLTIVGSGSSDRAISFWGADRCWVKNVEAKNFVGTTGTIFLWAAHQCEINRCYVHDCTGYPSQSDGFGYFLYYSCSNCLIVDSIGYHLGDACVVNGSAANAVVNCYADEITRAGQAFLTQGMICNHGPHGIMNLYEGNILQRFQNDGYHGSTSHTVLFRNQIHGLRDVVVATPRRVVDLCRGSYYHSLVGNILGDSSWDPAEYDYNLGDPTISCMYILGFPGMDSVSMGVFTSVPWANWTKSTASPDADVARTLLRHGNYDYYSKGVAWDSGISSRTIPDSLIYSAKPAYFGSLQWPPIGPDVAGLVTPIPAKARWDAYRSSGVLGDLFRNY